MKNSHPPIVQISLDLTDIKEAIETARIAVEAGVDWLEAGATHVVVMARAHAETIKCVVKAGRDFGVKVMGDNMVCDDKAAASKWMEDLGVDYIVHHTGFDERNGVFTDTGKRL